MTERHSTWLNNIHTENALTSCVGFIFFFSCYGLKQFDQEVLKFRTKCFSWKITLQQNFDRNYDYLPKRKIKHDHWKIFSSMVNIDLKHLISHLNLKTKITGFWQFLWKNMVNFQGMENEDLKLQKILEMGYMCGEHNAARFKRMCLCTF